MKPFALSVVLLAAFVAACAQPKPVEVRPDYDGAKSHSDRAHGSLDKESAD